MSIINSVVVALLSAIVGIAAGVVVIKQKIKNSESKQAGKGRSIVEEAEKQARQIRQEAQRQADRSVAQARNDVDREIKDRRREMDRREQQLRDKERNLEKTKEDLNEQQAFLNEKIEANAALKEKQEKAINDLIEQVQQVSKMTREDAEDILMKSVERFTRSRAGKMIKDIEEQARKVANRKAKEIVLDAIQKTAVEHTTSNTTAVVSLPDDEMKGRIIGKEGRNIRAFESVTGVDVIIDDTPNGVVLSAFNPIRREIARMAMEKLVEDGRIHPTRIEEVVAKSKEELDEIIVEHGERAADELGLQFHPKIIQLIGKLHYRTSYGQNILAHSLESAHIAGQMAEALGVNAKLAKRGAMLHDIGKALDFDHEGSHDDLGAEVCKKYGESEELLNCIMAHHEGEVADTVESVIVMVSDAISSVRPGARRESSDLYIKRLEALESIASSFEGVEKVYAIQAGREIRVFVKPEMVNDDSMYKLAQDIAKKVETEVDYPGEVKVSLVRETRAIGVAK